MVEETFIANTPKEAYDLAKEKYGDVELELVKAEQAKNDTGSLVSKITILVPNDEFKSSIGVSEEEELISEMTTLRAKINMMKDAIVNGTSNGEPTIAPPDAVTESTEVEEDVSDDNIDTTEVDMLPDAVIDHDELDVEEFDDADETTDEMEEYLNEEYSGTIATVDTLDLDDNEVEEDETSIASVEVGPTIPPPDSAVYGVKNIMLKNGIGEAWLDNAIGDVLDSDRAVDEQSLLGAVAEQIERGIDISSEDVSQPFMMMLVGSTGVGKTTTIAKLAARYSLLMDRPLKVALVNLDTFRVGAYEQLDKYAKMMHITHVKVKSIDEFDDTLASMSGYDVVLIDTAGISPYDTGKLLHTVEFLKKSAEYDVQTHLVVAATAKRDDVGDVYEHFSFLDIDNVILTKFDETQKVGELFSFLLENDIKVSYLSGGQNVPDDLEPASKKMLLDRFIGELDV